MKGFVGIGEQLPFTKTLALPAAYIYSISMKTPNPQSWNRLSGKAIVLKGFIVTKASKIIKNWSFIIVSFSNRYAGLNLECFQIIF